MFDRAIVGTNTIIGETLIDLNTHGMIAKACKRRTTSPMMLRITNKGGEVTKQIWFDVYNPKFVDNEGKKIS